MNTYFLGIVLSAGLAATACNKSTSGSEAVTSTPPSVFFAKYHSSASHWKPFLTCWREQVELRLAAGRSYNTLKRLPEELNRLPATQPTHVTELATTEARLGIRLPQSYRDFILASGNSGWYIESLSDPRDGLTLLQVQDIGSYPTLDPMNYGYWMSSGTDTEPLNAHRYFRYGYQSNPERRQDTAYFRLWQLRELIVIGRFASGGSILLNPKVVSADGEMEAWTLDFKSFAWRYRSFAEMMQNLAYLDVKLDAAKVPFDDPDALSEVRCTKMLRTAAG